MKQNVVFNKLLIKVSYSVFLCWVRDTNTETLFKYHNYDKSNINYFYLLLFIYFYFIVLEAMYALYKMEKS